MSSGAAFAPYELVGTLGSRPNPVHVVRQPAPAGGKPLLFVAEVFPGAARADDERGSELVRDARRIATLASPNLARVKEVVTRGDDLVVYGELLDGEKLQDLWRPEGLPLEIALRAIVDALTGLGALHNLRDAKQQPMKLVHGELSPATIVLGLDGVARVLHAIARRAHGVQPDPLSVGYMAPEVLAGDSFDQRADVFSAGVMLWEALSGKRLVDERDAAAAAARFRAGPLPPATVPDKAPWAKGLVDVAARALALPPDSRWATAALLAAEIRKSAGLKLAPASTAGAFAKSALGERVKARRARLEANDGSPMPAPVIEEANEVIVAPGIRAPVEEVIELGSEAMLEVPPSVPPPAAAPPQRGFVLDPFAASAKLAPSPPAPAVALQSAASKKSTLLGIPAPVIAPPPAPPPPAPSPAPAIVAPPPLPPPPPAPAPSPPPPIVAAPPPVPPPPIMAPVPLLAVDETPPPISGAPHFAAALDIPLDEPVPLRPLRQPLETAPSLTRQAEALAREQRAERMRKVFVLGGVGALGAAILVLALVRVASRPSQQSTATHAPTATAVASAPPPPIAIAPAPPPPAPAPVPPPPATVAAATPPPPPPPAQPAAPTPAPVAAKPPKPTPAAPVAAAAKPKPRPAAPPPAAPRPKKKSTFDPNTL